MWKHPRQDSIKCTKSTNDENGTILYMDGSKINARVRAAYVVQLDGVTLHTGLARLKDHCSVFQAEVWAIHKALTWLMRNNFKEARIRSDSQAALKGISNRFHSNKLVQDTTSLLHSLRKLNIELEWVKAHGA